MKIVAVCPNCGSPAWVEKDDGFECLVCNEFSYPEDMILTGENET